MIRRGQLRSSTSANEPHRRLAGGAMLACATGAAVLAALTTVAPASAARPATTRHAVASASPTALPPSLAKFANCPVANPKVTLCLFSSTNSTTFSIGSTTVTSSKPAKISLGAYFKSSGQIVVVLPDNGKPPLISPAIPLPGGLTGIPGLGGGILQVTVKPQMVGVPTLNLGALLTGHGVGMALPIDVLISTPTGILGPDCTIGASSTPINLQLTTGTTSPPPPNTPISGATGQASSKANGETTILGMKLVDNSFAVPGTSNCGPLGLFDPIINLQKGLPSAAGSNTAILAGSSYTIPASVIRKYLG